MTCQRFTSPGRTYTGTNLRVVAAPANCVTRFGFGSMVVADCWEQGSQGPEAGGGWCFPSSDAYQITNLSSSQCSKCLPAFDCINGQCLPRSTHNTAGFYASLEACQAACGGNPCNGECVSSAEIADLQAAANALQNKFCL